MTASDGPLSHRSNHEPTPWSRVPVSADPLLTAGTMVDHYRVMRLIGRGGMGEVFSARDMKLGRKVALKVVAPAQFESESMRDRFLVEARTTARFNHPNIVTIYGVGEYAGCPYLALEYLEGETLADRLRERRMGQGEAVRIAMAIAEALAEAHRNGVLHRDLKPGNVHLGRDGRVRVLDFGLAKVMLDPSEAAPPSSVRAEDLPELAELRRGRVDDLASRSFGVGTPAYMAPEQWLEEPCSEATDVWAFGVVLFAMLVGHLPFPATDAQELALEVCGSSPVPRASEFASVSPAMDDLTASCLRKEEGARITVEALVERLRALVDTRGRVPLEGTSPYRGLLPFTREDETHFFGRDAEVAAFVERVRFDPVLPVVGASGSGKSSFVQAGVFPRLLEQDRWTILSLRIGSDPFLALAARLVVGDEAASTSQRGRIAFDAPTRQREHATTNVPPGAATSSGSEHAQTSTRQDADPAGATKSPAIPSDRASSARALTRSGTHRKDVGPLAERLRQNPGQLAFELRALAEARNSRVLLFVDQLEELFTQGASEDTARTFIELLCAANDDPLEPVRVVFTIRDDFFGRLAVSPRVSAALGRVMLMQRPDVQSLEEILTGPVRALGYAYEDAELPREMVKAVANEPSCLPLLQFTANLLWERRDREKRTLTREAYHALGGVEGALAGHADGVLAALSETQLLVARKLLLRLVTPDRTRKVVAQDAALDQLGNEAPTVLGRLVEARLIATTKWLDTSATTVLELAHESLIRNWGTLRRWIDESHEDVVLLGQLEQAARLWHERGRRDEQLWRGDALGEAARIRARAASELPLQMREFVGASEFAENRLKRRKTGFFIGAFALAAIVAATSVFAALKIAKERDQAERRRAEALREAARAAVAQGQVLEGRAKLREALEVEDSTSARVLWRQLSENPLEWTGSLGTRLYAVSFSADGRTLAASGSDNAVHMLDTTTRTHHALRGHTDQVLSVDHSADGRWIASSGLDRTVRLWDATTGGSVRVLEGAREATHTARFSPDGTRVAAGSYAGDLHIWSVKDGRALRTWQGHTTPVRGIAWSPDSKQLVSGDASGNIQLWDGETGAALGELRGNDRTVYGLAWSPDGQFIASSALDGSVHLFDAVEHRELAVLRGHTSGLYRLQFSPDGKRLASAGSDRVVQLWEVATRTVVASYPIKGEASDVAFSRDGTRMAITSITANGEELYFLRTDKPPAGGLRTHDSVVNTVTISPDGDTIASGGSDGRMLLRNTGTGQIDRVLEAHQGAIYGLAFTQGGASIVTGGGDGAVRLWGRRGEILRTLLTHTSAIFSVGVSPDGKTFVAGGQDGAVFSIDGQSGSVRKVGQGNDRVRGVLVDARNSLIVSGGHDGRLRSWALADGTPKSDFDVGHGRVYGLAAHPNGHEVAASSADGTVTRIDLDTGSRVTMLEAKTRCYQGTYTKTGDFLVPCADGTVRVLPADGSASRTLAVHENEANQVEASADGRFVVTASDDFTVQLLEVGSWRPLWYANALLPEPGGSVLLHSQRGFTTLDGSPREPPNSPLFLASAQALRTATSREGTRACVATDTGDIELFDTASGQPLSKAAFKPTQLVASHDACFGLAERGLVRLDEHGERRLDVAQPQVLGSSDQGVAVATASGLVFLDEGGQTVRNLPANANVSALSERGGVLLLGYRDGHIDRINLARNEVKELEGTSASPVLRIAPGPSGVWIAGFGNGDVSLWSGDDLRRLDRARLHGAVSNVLVSKGVMYAATERGDGLTWDLHDLERPRCELLQEVFRAIPVIWRDGHAVLAPTDAQACR